MEIHRKCLPTFACRPCKLNVLTCKTCKKTCDNLLIITVITYRYKLLVKQAKAEVESGAGDSASSAAAEEDRSEVVSEDPDGAVPIEKRSEEYERTQMGD